MKLLYIGVYRDGTGWGNQAIEYMRAMNSVGIDVVARPIKLNDAQIALPEDILTLEDKNLSGVDVCVQHLLPEHMEYTSSCKNIGLINIESDNIIECGWAEHLKCLCDNIWIPSTQIKETVLRKANLEYKTTVIPTPVNIEKVSKQYQPLDIPELEDSFVFYYIGEFTRRKNLSALLKAFHTEFSPEEPVNLLIKTNADITKFCDEIKSGLRLYKNLHYYKKEILITQYVSEADMMRIHATGDCFVMPSLGEGWNIPAAEACAMGKTPVMVNWGGNTEFLNESTGYPVNYTLSPAFGMIDTLPNLHGGFENLAQIDILDLRKQMRLAYENEDRKIKAEYGKDYMKNFSYQSVGDLVKACLGVV